MANRDDEDQEKRIGLWVTGAVAGLATVVTLFLSVWGWENGRIEGSPNYGAAASAASAVNEQAASDAAHDHAHDADAGHDHAAMASDAAALADMPADASAASAESVAAEGAAQVADAASVVVENGVVKFYFASGKSELAAGAQEALKDVIDGVKAGKKAVISGYHDSTGNAAQNEELSKQRAFAVKDALVSWGVDEAQIELRKPADAQAGEGNDAEARRVEVVLE